MSRIIEHVFIELKLFFYFSKQEAHRIFSEPKFWETHLRERYFVVPADFINMEFIISNVTIYKGFPGFSFK